MSRAGPLRHPHVGKRGQVDGDSHQRPEQQGDHCAGRQVQRQQQQEDRGNRRAHPAQRIGPVQRGRHRRGTGQRQQGDRDGRRGQPRQQGAVDVVVGAERGAHQPRPEQPGDRHENHAEAGDHRGRCHQGPQPVGALVDEVGDQVALHRRQRNHQRCTGQRHRQDHHTAGRTEIARGRLEQHWETHHQHGAGTCGGDRVRGAAQERHRSSGRQQPGSLACRRGGDQHDQPRHRPRDSGPQEPGQTPAEHEGGRGHGHSDDGVGHHQRPVLGPPVRPRPACRAGWRASRTRPARRSTAPR